MANVKVEVEPETLAAFIGYDLFPYMEFREVKRITYTANGPVIVCNGYAYTPLVIMPYDEALALWERIKAIKAAYVKQAEVTKAAAIADVIKVAPALTSIIKDYNREGK
jgi:hypothetical protein